MYNGGVLQPVQALGKIPTTNQEEAHLYR